MIPTDDQDSLDHAMLMLFTARWSIPTAAAHLGMRATEESWSQLKALFAEYCKTHGTTYKEEHPGKDSNLRPSD